MTTEGSPRRKAIVVTPYPLPQLDTSVQVEIVMPRTIQLPPILVENPLLGSFPCQMQHAPSPGDLRQGIRVYPSGSTDLKPSINKPLGGAHVLKKH